jgi:alpha-1,2-mannosyltransferase
MTSLAILLAACLLGPPLAVGLTAIRIPWQVTAAFVSAAGIVVLWRLAQQVRAVDRRRLQWPAIVALLAVLGGATFYTVRLSGFMLDERRADWSVLPARPFFRAHSCLSAYTEAARLATTGVNIFETAPYSQPGKPDVPRTIGSFEVDLYLYPPAFLLLPRLAEAGGVDFMTTRRIWFALQSAAMWLAIVVLARWIGGGSGLLVLLLAPIIWLAPTTRVTLQIGNFQTTAFALSLLAMVAFERGRSARGGSLLGFAIVSKIYPGMLGILLAADRRWSGIAWTTAWAGAFALAAFLWLGAAPFVDFVRYQVPRIQSAEAFFWITQPEMAPINYGIHGLVLKLRALGLPWTGASAASLAASAYAIGLVAVAAAAAVRLGRARAGQADAEGLRLRQAQVWLALLNLASFRSPFVPDAYALVGTLWLLTMIAAEGHWRPIERVLLVIAALATTLVLDGGVVTAPVPAWIVIATLLLQLGAIGMNLVVALTPGRGPLRRASAISDARPAGLQPSPVQS